MSLGQFAPVILGVASGVALTLIVMEFGLRRQKRQVDLQKRSSSDCRIITDVLKFYFRANDILNELWVDKEVWFKFHKDIPEKTFEFEQRMVRRFDDNTRKDFFNELMFYSFQLRLLDNKTICEDFESLMGIFKELSERLLLSKSREEYADLEKRYNSEKKKFLDKCAHACK
jgi:hypothetical protein